MGADHRRWVGQVRSCDTEGRRNRRGWVYLIYIGTGEMLTHKAVPGDAVQYIWKSTALFSDDVITISH